MNKFTCSVCGFEFEAETTQAICPVCGAEVQTETNDSFHAAVHDDIEGLQDKHLKIQ